jgi:hypothetical protein
MLDTGGMFAVAIQAGCTADVVRLIDHVVEAIDG